MVICNAEMERILGGALYILPLETKSWEDNWAPAPVPRVVGVFQGLDSVSVN